MNLQDIHDRFIHHLQSLCERHKGLEGFFEKEQCLFLDTFLKTHPSIHLISEIGFNVGMSSFVNLFARSDTKVVSFDLGVHSYVPHQKKFLDELFPGRHTLCIGDSRETLPSFANLTGHNPIFDFCIVDGGHTDDIPLKDCLNSLAMLKPGGWILIDDVIENEEHKAVKDAVHYLLDSEFVINEEYNSTETRGWLIAQKPIIEVSDHDLESID
jgi:predicted O-methyltransferase YrrM